MFEGKITEKKLGPKEKINAELIEKIAGLIRMGMYTEQAVACCGISRGTYYKWLRIGGQQKEGLYRDLVDLVEKALAQGMARDLHVIDTAAQQGQWQAAAWKLERKFPRHWGRQERLELTGSEGGPIETYSLSKEERIERIKKLDDQLKLTQDE